MPISSNTFLWGATITAHAAEGGDFDADWWRWEQRPGRIKGGATSEVAADHLHRYKDDLGLARKLGLNALLYSLSWARIEPRQGQYCDAALTHYADVFQTMTRHGITPLAVLQEHSLPEWFAQAGGWDNPEAPAHFVAYLRRVYDALSAHCTHWLPHLDPMHWQRMAYAEKHWPAPNRGRTWQRPGIALIAQSHAAVWAWLREQDTRNEVGLSLAVRESSPLDPHSPWDLRACRRLARFDGEFYAAAVRSAAGSDRPCTFTALSVLEPQRVCFAPLLLRNLLARAETVRSTPETDITVLRRGLAALGDCDLPTLIIAPGSAESDSIQRCTTLLNQVDTVLDLQQRGARVLGFCVRPLMDGFEWHLGFTRHTGLIHVDRETLARTPNPAAFLYQDIAQHNTIRPGAVSRYCPEWHSPVKEAC